MHIAQKKQILYESEKLQIYTCFHIFIPLFPFYTQSNIKKIPILNSCKASRIYFVTYNVYHWIELQAKAFMNSVFSFFVYQFFFFILCLTFSLFEHITFVSCYNSEKDYCYTNPLFYFCVFSIIFHFFWYLMQLDHDFPSKVVRFVIYIDIPSYIN